jgi:hypothetical protein
MPKNIATFEFTYSSETKNMFIFTKQPDNNATGMLPNKVYLGKELLGTNPGKITITVSK